MLRWVAAAGVAGALVVLPLSFADRMLLAVTLAVGGVLLLRESPLLRASALAALVASAAYTHVRAENAPTVTPTRTQRFQATVLSERSESGDLHTYVLALDRGPHALAAFPRPLPLGARVLVRGRLAPLDEARNPGEPSERSMLAESGIDARLESPNLLAVTPSSNDMASALARLHAFALDALRSRLPEPASSIVAGELWGERAALPPDLRKEFQETGTVHVLVTAGLHVGLIAWLVVFAGMRLTLPRAFTCGLAILAVWAFAGFSGLHVPALRAASMATVMLCARACGRATFSWDTLALASLAIVAWFPQSVATPSFWLSFCCVGAIFACTPWLERALEPLQMPERLREPLLLTLATQLGTWPITAAVFLQFSTYAPAANLAVVPFVPVTMTLGIAQLLLRPLAPLAQGAANLNAWAIAWIIGVVHTLATLPMAIVRMTPAPTWCLALYEGALLVTAPLAARGALTLALALLIEATSLVLLPPQRLHRELRITVLDVGQADSIVIQTPGHHTILVDAGGRLERGGSGNDSVAEMVGERIVVPFLLREGIHRLDALVVSHPHGDHVGGCAPALRAIVIAEIADSGQTYGGHAYHDCLNTATSDRVPIVHPRAGDIWRLNDGVTLTFIGPSLPFITGKNAINDNSIAFVLQYRAFRMLFTGDAGVAAERRFLREGIDLSAAVLKVGHHGSAYSSSQEFIAAVHPGYAIISVGRHNMFGHPAPSTIERLRNDGIRIFRTDQNGAVIVESQGARDPETIHNELETGQYTGLP